jgi:hypothetical protein
MPFAIILSLKGIYGGYKIELGLVSGQHSW